MSISSLLCTAFSHRNCQRLLGNHQCLSWLDECTYYPTHHENVTQNLEMEGAPRLKSGRDHTQGWYLSVAWPQQTFTSNQEEPKLHDLFLHLHIMGNPSSLNTAKYFDAYMIIKTSIHTFSTHNDISAISTWIDSCPSKFWPYLWLLSLLPWSLPADNQPDLRKFCPHTFKIITHWSYTGFLFCSQGWQICLKQVHWGNSDCCCTPGWQHQIHLWPGLFRRWRQLFITWISFHFCILKFSYCDRFQRTHTCTTLSSSWLASLWPYRRPPLLWGWPSSSWSSRRPVQMDARSIWRTWMMLWPS